MDQKVRIVIADDHAMFREALRRLLEAEPDLYVVGEAVDGHTAVALTRTLRPDVLLLDMAMPGADGLEALRQLSTAPHTTRILLLTAAIDRPALLLALELGAGGLVLKESTVAMLIKGIRGVMAGHSWVGRAIVSDLVAVLRHHTPGVEATKTFGLTVREREIVSAVGAAYSNKAIADRFQISDKTVKHHLTNIFDKLGVSNRLELALFAVDSGLVLPAAEPTRHATR